MVSKEEIEQIMKTEGEVRGTAFLTDAQYVLAKEGKAGLEKVEEKTKEWGHHIDYQNIKNMTWYPVGLRALSILACKEVFGWAEENIKDMGYSAPAYSFIVKMLLKYFLTLKQAYLKSPDYWKKHYTVGDLKSGGFDEKEKYLALDLHDFKIHPALCPYYAGYFLRIAGLGAKEEITGVEETKCAYRGDKYHQYTIKWQ